MSFFAPASDNPEDSGGSHHPMIGRQAEIRIRGSGYLALCDVTCIARGDILHLRGRLPSHYLKQIAQEIAAGVDGVRHVDNGIEVSARPNRGRAERQSKDASAIESNLTSPPRVGRAASPTANKG